MRLSAAYDFLPKSATVRSAQVMDHFGVSFEQGRHVIADGVELPIEPGQVVLFTGPSGSGKSTLMRAVARQIAKAEAAPVTSLQPVIASGTVDIPVTPSGSTTVIDLDQLVLPDVLLIDALGLPADAGMGLLSTCGLGEAQLMLRTPAELSDGQRYRFRLALALSRTPNWIVADEFSAMLDRTLAKVIAYNVRRLADRTGVGFLLATTHQDVAADLRADWHVQCRLGEAPLVVDHTGQPYAPHRPPEVLQCEATALPQASGAGKASDTAPRPTRSKKSVDLIPLRPLALYCDPCRLAVLRSVALPVPPPRPHPLPDLAMG
ncbi:MAG: ATP-binding cassette domain-containing protein [Planctomycetaceae bacterium]